MKKGHTKPWVYIAGPLTDGDTFDHIRVACGVWEQLRGLDMQPICPHWSAMQEIAYPISHNDWIKYDLELVTNCDALLHLPGKSHGAGVEVCHAAIHGIPVFDSVSELLEWSETL